MKGLPTGTRSFWSMMGDVFVNYWGVLRATALMVALYIVFALLVGFISVTFTETKMVSEHLTMPYVLLLFAVSFLEIYIFLVLFFYAHHLLCANKTKWRTAFRTVGRRLFRIFSAVVFLLLISFIFIIIASVLAGVLYHFHSPKWMLFLVFGLVCVFPIFYLCIKFSMALPLIVLENGKVFKSLWVSGKMVSGRNWFRAFGVLLIYFLLVFVALICFFILSSLKFLGDDLGLVLTLIFALIFSVLIFALLINMLIFLYHDLRLRHSELKVR